MTCTALVLVILLITYCISSPGSGYDKLTPYECGFAPFGDARSFFDVQFYTVGLLFIIFDLEVVFLMPFVIGIEDISAFGYLNMLIFMSVVVAGFRYEWALGLLNWIPSKKFVNSTPAPSGVESNHSPLQTSASN